MILIDRVQDLPNPLWLTGPAACGKTELSMWLQEYFEWKIYDYEKIAHAVWREATTTFPHVDDAIIYANSIKLQETIEIVKNSIADGNNIVIDCLISGIYDPELIDFTARKYNITPVHVLCSPETLRKRRTERGGQYLTSVNSAEKEIQIYNDFIQHRDSIVINTDEHLIDFKLHNGYQEVFLGQKRIRSGARSAKRIDMIDWKDVNGKNVIDIGCSSGMLGINAEKNGAKYVLGVDNSPVVKFAKQIAYNSGCKNISFKMIDIESEEFKRICNLYKFEVGFFCAILQWLENKEEFVMFLDSIIQNVLYFETNLNYDEGIAMNIMQENTTFKNLEYIGNSGDGEQVYKLWRFSR